MRDKSLRSGERQHAEKIAGIEEHHLWRYREACKYIKPTDTVVDLGCGVGYGSKIMSEVAREVCGYDDSRQAIEFAEKHYNGNNIRYYVNDLDYIDGEEIAGTAPFDSLLAYGCDVIVAFEIIEHLNDTDATFLMFKRISPKLIILSTPHLKCPIRGNKFHYRHYGMDELIDSFWNIGYKPKRAELIYFGAGLCNFMVMGRR